MPQRTPQDAYQAIEAAVSSFIGWTLVYLAAWSLVFGIGLAIRSESFGNLAYMFVAPIALVFLPFAGLTDIMLMIGALAVPALWALPLYYDWHGVRPAFILLMLPFAYRMGSSVAGAVVIWLF